MYFHVLLYWIYYMVIICLGAVRVINIIFITNIIIIIITTISMIISLDLLTGGIKLVGNQGLVILYCNAIQAYQYLIFVLEKKYIIFISSISK